MSQIAPRVGETVGCVVGTYVGDAVGEHLPQRAGQWISKSVPGSEQLAKSKIRQMPGSYTPWHWMSVGECVGNIVGVTDGDDVVGETVGDSVGSEVVGNEVGADSVGSLVGVDEGNDVVGDVVGEIVGDTDGEELVGKRVGTLDEGALVGDSEGNLCPKTVGDHVGAAVGLHVMSQQVRVHAAWTAARIPNAPTQQRLG